MTLILLAISLSITLCVLAFNFAIYALPVMAGIVAFQHVYSGGAGFGLSVLAALGGAIISTALVLGVLGYAKNPFLRLGALLLFAAPAAFAGYAGYALAHGLAKHAIESALVLNLLCGTSGFIIAIAAILNLNAIGSSALSR